MLTFHFTFTPPLKFEWRDSSTQLTTFTIEDEYLLIESTSVTFRIIWRLGSISMFIANLVVAVVVIVIDCSRPGWYQSKCKFSFRRFSNDDSIHGNSTSIVYGKRIEETTRIQFETLYPFDRREGFHSIVFNGYIAYFSKCSLLFFEGGGYSVINW